MNIHILASDAPMSEWLRTTAQSLGFTVQSASVRQPQQALSAWLTRLDTGALLVCSAPEQFEDDCKALEPVLWAHPGLSAVLLSPGDSRAQLVQAMRSGVREVVSFPPVLAELSDALQRVQAHHQSMGSLDKVHDERGRMVAFMSCKGGCGSTFVATNMAYLMSGEFKRRCAFIDLDLQYGDASFYMSHDESRNSISDLTQQIERLDAQLLGSCMQSIGPQLSLLAAPEEPGVALTITAKQLEQVLSLARSTHELVVLDLDCSIDALTLKALDMADTVYLVMQSTMPVIRNAKRLVRLFRSLGYPDDKLRLLVNKYQTDDVMDAKGISQAVGLEVHHTIPNQVHAVTEAINLGQPMDVVHPHNGVLKSLREITSVLLETPVPKVRGWLGRWMGKAA